MTLVRSGPTAAPDEPVCVFQAMRFMDEEFLIHLQEGGADYADWDGFVEHLVANPQTLDRLIGTPRGLC